MTFNIRLNEMETLQEIHRKTLMEQLTAISNKLGGLAQGVQ